MKCPHCLMSFHTAWKKVPLGTYAQLNWYCGIQSCPECNGTIVGLGADHERDAAKTMAAQLVFPRTTARPRLPVEVTEPFASDYREACLVFADSPKASAALSRRCLQNILRDVAKVKPQDLSKEIEEVVPKLPAHLGTAVDEVRTVGKFAAHPLKSTNTGAILDVEPGEPEWLLDVLDGLFDFYFVQPALLKAKRDALNAKLKDAGKPPI
jgi:Domain of unknown function (DUF4145)